MRVLEFEFSGRLNVQLDGTNSLINDKGDTIDPCSMTDQEIVQKLENGEIYVSFSQAWKNANFEELEMCDYFVDTAD